MKIIFFGTPPFAAEIIQFLLDHHVQISAIVTQPDRPKGRHLQKSGCAVKELATHIPLFQPEKASDPVFLEKLAAIHADLFVVVAYGQILSRKLLAIPPLGCINVHASLLPKYRGAAPMQRCLMNGDKETGVCIQKMVYELDAGDVIDAAKIVTSPEMTLHDLEESLCEMAKPLLLSVLKKYQSGIPPAQPQDASQVVLAPKIKPEETEIHWNQDAESLHNLVRALSPHPGAWCWVVVNGEKRRLKIFRTKVAMLNGLPGELVAFQKDTCIVGAKSQSLQLLEVQPEGKKRLSVGEWIRGCQSPPQFNI